MVGLAAGVMLLLAPGVGTGYALAGMTSLLGRSHTFDKRADGYARGEACGAVALRRMAWVARGAYAFRMRPRTLPRLMDSLVVMLLAVSQMW